MAIVSDGMGLRELGEFRIFSDINVSLFQPALALATGESVPEHRVVSANAV